MPEIKFDFTEKIGKIKPMHGVNGGSLTGSLRNDAREYFKEAGFPITRLHDCEYPYGSGEFVDVPCIFKNFNADVDDPESYNFLLTDHYINAIVECGTKILYRLGISIDHGGVKRYVEPPKDYLKWAKICEHIIMHYNEGWANGFHHNIEFWEIWTEPNHNEDKLFWDGTPEEFAEFYTVSASYLKEKFPKLKIGGPAFSHPATEFPQRFFKKLTENGKHPPMDFYSWHGYVCKPELAVERSRLAKEILEKHGYTDTLGVYDEWNYVKSWQDMDQVRSVVHGDKSISFNLAMMCTMQNEFCDVMNYYALTKVRQTVWNGLFGIEENASARFGKTKPIVKFNPFYAFKAFNELYKLQNQIKVENTDPDLYTLGATDGKKSIFVVSYYTDLGEECEDKEVKFSLKGVEGKKMTLYLCDSKNALRKIYSSESRDFSFNIATDSFIMVEFE